MFCYQCEQTAKGTGCTSFGVCGKDPETAALQDLLLYEAKAISVFAHRAAELDARDCEVDRFVVEALFTTVTNVNFDPARLQAIIVRGAQVRDKAKQLYEDACAAKGQTPDASTILTEAANWQPAADLAGLLAQGEGVGVETYVAKHGETITGLQQLLTYGLKGAAAYADHAAILGQSDPAVYAYFHEALNFLAEGPDDVNALVGQSLKCGEVNLKVMELLDTANTGAYGDPVPTPVRVTPVAGKAILVSGHDLKDLYE
ncbi:MAG: hydroxylamine reductase, partial [Armatimonadota bacterium]